MAEKQPVHVPVDCIKEIISLMCRSYIRHLKPCYLHATLVEFLGEALAVRQSLQ